MQPTPMTIMTWPARQICHALLLIGLAIVVSACATERITPLSTHPTVSVNVYPAGSATPAGWTCMTKDRYMLCVSEEPVDLTNDTSPVTIPWSLVANGWTFTNQGIKILRGGGWQETRVTPTQYTATSRSKNSTIYKYVITVTNGTDTVTWDPFIWNN